MKTKDGSTDKKRKYSIDPRARLVHGTVKQSLPTATDPGHAASHYDVVYKLKPRSYSAKSCISVCRPVRFFANMVYAEINYGYVK